MRSQDTYIQYGVSRELAAQLEGINLPVTTFRIHPTNLWPPATAFRPTKSGW